MEPNSPLDATDGFELSWGTPIVERSHAKAAIFLEPLDMMKTFAQNAVAIQEPYYAGRSKDFFTSYMFVGEVMLEFLAPVAENLDAIAASVRHSLKSILLSPEVAMLPSETSNAMKTYFCDDGYRQQHMYDVTSNLGVHIRSSSITEKPVYHDEMLLEGERIYLDNFLRSYDSDIDNYLDSVGLSNAEDTLVRSEIEFYIVLRVEENTKKNQNTKWIDMIPPSLASMPGYRMKHDTGIQDTPDFIWVPYRESVALGRSNFPRFSREKYSTFASGYDRYWNYIDVETGRFTTSMEASGQDIRGVGLWMRPPPYSIIAPMLFSNMDEHPELNGLYFLVHSPYLNDSMEPGGPNMAHTRYNRIPRESMFMYEQGYGQIMSEFATAADDSIAFFADKLNIYRLKGKWKSITITIPMLKAVGREKRPLKLTNELFDEIGVTKRGTGGFPPQRQRRRTARRQLFTGPHSPEPQSPEFLHGSTGKPPLQVITHEDLERMRQERRFREATQDPLAVITHDDLEEMKRRRQEDKLAREEELRRERQAFNEEWERLQREREERERAEGGPGEESLFLPETPGDFPGDVSGFDPFTLPSSHRIKAKSLKRGEKKKNDRVRFQDLKLPEVQKTKKVPVKEDFESDNLCDEKQLASKLDELTIAPKKKLSKQKRDEEKEEEGEEEEREEDAFLF